MGDVERQELVSCFKEWLEDKASNGPRLHFECSMLQTAVEGEDGVVRWRDVTCDDVDDFEALWSTEWATVETGEVMWSCGCRWRGTL